MPTYQYQCTDCGHFFEIVQKFSDDSLTVCPECEGRLRKVFNAVGVVFKGSGFYRTDSREAAKSAKNSSKDAGSGSSSDPGKAPKETSSPSKPSSTNSSPTTSSSGTPSSGTPSSS